MTTNPFASLDWARIADGLNADGYAEIGPVLSADACSGLVSAYQDDERYRSRVVIEPRKVLAEFGTEIADDVEVRVHDSTADLRYIVLPMRPAETADWDNDR